MKVSIVIPTLNEEEGIDFILRKIPKDLNCETIVADNGSMDRTVEVAKKYGARVVHEKKRGYGSAYKSGFKHAKGNIIATMDGDASYDPQDIKKLLKVLKEKNVDFVSGDRLKNLKRESLPFLNLIGNYILSFISNMMFSTRIHDSQSGMWVFYKELLKKIELKEDGMSFSSEIKLEAWEKGKFVEHPISYHKRKGKKTMNTFKQGFQILIFLLKRRFFKNP